MLCPKCNTAVLPKMKTCGYCKARIDRRRIGKLSFAVFVLIALIIAPVVLFVPDDIAADDDVLAYEQQNAPRAVGQPSSLSGGGSASVSPAADERLIADIEAELMFVAQRAADYILDNMGQNIFLTMSGCLYNYTTGSFVTPYDVVPYENQDRSGIILLYLRTHDLAARHGMNVISANTLTVFAAYETQAGYLLVSKENGSGIISREDLSLLQAMYTPDGGEIRLVTDADEFEPFHELLEEMFDEQLIIRYLAHDDKYAVIVVSPTTNTSVYHSHVLCYNDDRWEAGLLNYERSGMPKSSVNAQYTDINPELVPDWRLDATSLQMRTNFAQIRELMYERELIASDERIVFLAGYGDFCYVETERGLRFIGHYITSWNFSSVFSYEQAVSDMRRLAGDTEAPLFIMKAYTKPPAADDELNID